MSGGNRSIHLVREMHDVVNHPVIIWCESEVDWRLSRTEDIGEATCIDCLGAVVSLGGLAEARLYELRVEAARERGERT